MSTARRLIIICLISLDALIALPANADIFSLTSIPTILPLGDSITAGGDGSYRKHLYNLLNSDGYKFVFVGSQHSGNFADNEHEGHGGWTPEELLNGKEIDGKTNGGIDLWLDYSPADIIIIHAGTNGVSLGTLDYDPDTESFGQHVKNIESILDHIFSHNLSAIVVLAQIIQQREFNANISEYNRQLGVMADGYWNTSRVVVVNLENVLEFKPSNYIDSTHPSDIGYAIMANSVYPAVKLALGQFSASPTLVDSNMDGLADNDAIRLNLDPFDPVGDTDNDGKPDIVEIGSDIINPLDSDGDGIIDALEPDPTDIDSGVASGLRLPGGGSAIISTQTGEMLSKTSAGEAINAPASIIADLGIINYVTTASVPGAEVTVKIYFSADLPASPAVYKVDNIGEYKKLPSQYLDYDGCKDFTDHPYRWEYHD